jgi:hypothetical protein
VKGMGAASVVEVALGERKVAGDYFVKLRMRSPLVPAPFDVVVIGRAAVGPVSSPALMEVQNLSASDAGVRLGNLAVSQRSGKVKVRSVRSDDMGLKFEVDQDSRGERAWVAVIYKGGWGAGARQSMIHIKTDHSTLPILEVPLIVKLVE